MLVPEALRSKSINAGVAVYDGRGWRQKFSGLVRTSCRDLAWFALSAQAPGVSRFCDVEFVTVYVWKQV
jgi:hypothetical protein